MFEILLRNYGLMVDDCVDAGSYREGKIADPLYTYLAIISTVAFRQTSYKKDTSH